MELLLAALLTATPVEKPLPALPSISGLKLDGKPSEFARAKELKMPKFEKGQPAISVKAAMQKTSLVLGLQVSDSAASAESTFEITLFFPDSGTTSRGIAYRFASDGAPLVHPEYPPPDFAKDLVKAKAVTDKKGTTLEIEIGARALPRFHAQKQMAISICAQYQRGDQKVTTCPKGDVEGGYMKIPDEFRKSLKLNPPSDVEGIEARQHGWVGFSKLHYPTWAQGDGAFTPESLGEVIAGDQALAPESVSLAIPAELKLHDGRVIYTVITGANPYVKDTCVQGSELRMAMYIMNLATASRVLEWPAATCKLGRAMSFELSPEGNLVIGYTNGVTAHFTWMTNHFERSELGGL
jgi:hypothetical protein